MSRRLLLIAAIAGAFGLGAHQALGEFSDFVAANLALAACALLGALVLSLRGLEDVRQPTLRGPVLRALAELIALCLAATLLYHFAAGSDIRFDWTFEGRYELAPATLKVLDALPDEVEMTLYSDPGDPRRRHTRMLLEQFALGRTLRLRDRLLDQSPEDEDRYGIASSNTVVLRRAERWARVERPDEGTLLEALLRLTGDATHRLYVGIGAGEGDLERSDDRGYSGLRGALETEGYRLQPLPLAALRAIPQDADGLMLIAPRRPLGGAGVEAIARYIDRGGALIVFLEPGSESDLEALLASYGLHSPDALVIDPESGAVEGDPAGFDPLARAYAEHPVTLGLDRNRMTFFRRARAFELRKARPDDRLSGLVFSSGDAWLAQRSGANEPPESLRRPADARGNYRVLVAAAELKRGSGRARILAFGDADLASNRYLRTLYNLDLVLNGVHWALARERAITLRPKTGGRQMIQFPVPLQHSLRAFYGVGLLVPELALIVGGLVWLRQRRA